MATRFELSRRDILIGASAASFAATLPAHAKAPMQNTQAPGVYRFKVGAFEATVISDGPLIMGPPQADVFVGLSKDDFIKALDDNFLASDSLALEQNMLLLNTGDRLVLFDTGAGSSKMMGPHRIRRERREQEWTQGGRNKTTSRDAPCQLDPRPVVA